MPLRARELTLRLARYSEASLIAHMSRDLVEGGLAWRWTPRRIAASILAPDVNVLVACDQEKIVGFAIMRYGDDKAHLNLLAVAPSHRRTGIGRRLIAWLEECAVVAGIFTVTLEFREGNHSAHFFYANLGYRPIRQIPGYYQGREAALRMRRDLRRRGLLRQ